MNRRALDELLGNNVRGGNNEEMMAAMMAQRASAGGGNIEENDGTKIDRCHQSNRHFS
jgi:hypothetical protein